MFSFGGERRGGEGERLTEGGEGRDVVNVDGEEKGAGRL